MDNHDFDGDRIRHAIQELQSEPVYATAKSKALKAMERRASRFGSVPFVAAAAAVTITMVVILWPERKAMAWSTVVQSTLGTSRIHRADFVTDRKGGWTHSGDEWIDGNKRAIKGTMMEGLVPPIKFDYRNDGKKTYRIDWTGYGIVTDSRFRKPLSEELRRYSIEGLLADSRVKIDSMPTEVTVDGVKALRYKAKVFEGPVKYGFSTPMAIYAEITGGRVIRTELFGRLTSWPSGQLDKEITEYSTVDYPTSIPEETFLPPTTGIRVFDLTKDAETLKTVMAHGVSLGNGNVLRAAIQAPTGELVVLWTGTAPNGDGSQAPTVVGNPSHGVFAPDEITASRWKSSPKAIYKFEGKPLCGLALQVKTPVSGKVTLRIPILAPDPHSPIRNKRGEVKGYRSKQVGIAIAKDFPVLESMPFTLLSYMKAKKIG